VDIDGNGQFSGQQETAHTISKAQFGNEALYDFNWLWKGQYSVGTYGLRVDFTNGQYYFTGNSTELARTGAYINVIVVGTF